MVSTANLPVTGEKILPLFHLLASSNISLLSPLQTEALSHEHADFYISLLLSNVGALLVPNFQRSFSLHANPPRHIIIPLVRLSATSLLRQCAQSCTRFFFPAEVPALRLWDQPIYHHINTLQSCPRCPQSPLLNR